METPKHTIAWFWAFKSAHHTGGFHLDAALSAQEAGWWEV